LQEKSQSPEIKAHIGKLEKHLLQRLSDQIKKTKIKYNIKKKKGD